MVSLYYLNIALFSEDCKGFFYFFYNLVPQTNQIGLMNQQVVHNWIHLLLSLGNIIAHPSTGPRQHEPSSR
jgi:hypothetical protein